MIRFSEGGDARIAGPERLEERFGGYKFVCVSLVFSMLCWNKVSDVCNLQKARALALDKQCARAGMPVCHMSSGQPREIGE